MKRIDKYGLIVGVVSLAAVFAGNIVGPPFLLLGGGLALLVRSFFPPLSLGQGLAAWFGGGFLGTSILGSLYFAAKFDSWNSSSLFIGFLPAFFLGAGLVYFSFKTRKESQS